MVRFSPPIVRLLTLALHARLHRDGAPPATAGVAGFESPRPLAVGYRASRRGAAPGEAPDEDVAAGAPPLEPLPVGYRDSRRESTPSDVQNEGRRRRGVGILDAIRRGGVLNAIRSTLPGRKIEDELAIAYRSGKAVRSEEERVSAQAALLTLMRGNGRYIRGESERLSDYSAEGRRTIALESLEYSMDFDGMEVIYAQEAMADFGERPMAAIVGCAEAHSPLELVFDTQPGDLLVLRNAGNTVTSAEDSMVGGLEYSVNVLGINLILFMGRTDCGVIMGAAKALIAEQKSAYGAWPETTSDNLLAGFRPVVQQAQVELGTFDAEEIAVHAIKTNVYTGMRRLLEYSASIREKVASGAVQVQGAVFDQRSGRVEFLGEHPQLAKILGE